ncbi:hypothetical protein [Deinococcus radiotolerans]|uniref:Uncharacterized protein n=1 Tax=Deinococcus radiotolerans TaxID=1309407 RepID=A0ABQ2FHH2_9DEIO|nr:hypothetical protein [Deinococcus radiotolerans]GGK95580.1 hypothetical protein GCM10010844_12560 [Deinococcus radiotolerans]
MSSGTNVILPVDAAMRAYEGYRAEVRRAGNSRVQAIGQAQWMMFEHLTAPYRVVRLTSYGQEVHPHYVVYLVRGHGLEEEAWYFRGDHRERDAVRMSVMLRNHLMFVQTEALEAGDVDWSLRRCLPNVQALTGEQGSNQQAE